MKESNDFLKFLDTCVPFTPNYNDLKYRVNENQFKKRYNNKVHIFKYATIALYTVVICCISIFLTILVKDDQSKSISPTPNIGNVNPGKERVEYLEKHFDSFFAFGSGSPASLFTFDIIINSNLISDNDKQMLQEYKNSEDFSNYCNIYLGSKDEIDIVHIVQLGEPYKVFTFKSNLGYSFKEVIDEFGNLSDKEITNDFLYGSKFDDGLKKESSGILLSFKRVEDIYVPYYTMMLDDKIYVIDK